MRGRLGALGWYCLLELELISAWESEIVDYQGNITRITFHEAAGLLHKYFPYERKIYHRQKMIRDKNGLCILQCSSSFLQTTCNKMKGHKMCPDIDFPHLHCTFHGPGPSHRLQDHLMSHLNLGTFQGSVHEPRAPSWHLWLNRVLIPVHLYWLLKTGGIQDWTALKEDILSQLPTASLCLQDFECRTISHLETSYNLVIVILHISSNYVLPLSPILLPLRYNFSRAWTAFSSSTRFEAEISDSSLLVDELDPSPSSLTAWRGDWWLGGRGPPQSEHTVTQPALSSSRYRHSSYKEHHELVFVGGVKKCGRQSDSKKVLT